MNAILFVLPVVILPLGYAIGLIVLGFARAVQARQFVTLGWATGLLAVVLLLDAASFWNMLWQLRDVVPLTYWLLLLGLAIAMLYALAAQLVFPPSFAPFKSLDPWFRQNKAWVAGSILLANLLATAGVIAVGQNPLPDLAYKAFFALFAAALIAVMLVRQRHVVIALLVGLILFYPLTTAWPELASLLG